MIDVSIIIINYNTTLLTKECIDSIINKTKNISYEIILVDNASFDKNIESLKTYNLKFIQNNSNLGFGKANNIGAKYAKGKYIFLLNSDTLLMNNSIEILFNFMEENETVGICGGNLYFENEVPNVSYYPSLTLFREALLLWLPFIGKRLLGQNSKHNYSNKPIKVGYITGADLFIRKGIFDKINGFDEDFFMYAEETELTFRVKKLGFSVMSVPKARILHYGGGSTVSSEKMNSIYYESRYMYFLKTHGVFYSKAILIQDTISFLIKSIIYLYNKNKAKNHFSRIILAKNSYKKSLNLFKIKNS